VRGAGGAAGHACFAEGVGADKADHAELVGVGEAAAIECRESFLDERQ